MKRAETSAGDCLRLGGVYDKKDGYCYTELAPLRTDRVYLRNATNYIDFNDFNVTDF